MDPRKQSVLDAVRDEYVNSPMDLGRLRDRAVRQLGDVARMHGLLVKGRIRSDAGTLPDPSIAPQALLAQAQIGPFISRFLARETALTHREVYRALGGILHIMARVAGESAPIDIAIEAAAQGTDAAGAWTEVTRAIRDDVLLLLRGDTVEQLAERALADPVLGPAVAVEAEAAGEDDPRQYAYLYFQAALGK